MYFDTGITGSMDSRCLQFALCIPSSRPQLVIGVQAAWAKISRALSVRLNMNSFTRAAHEPSTQRDHKPLHELEGECGSYQQEKMAHDNNDAQVI